MFNPSKINALVKVMEYHHGICQSNIQLLYKKHRALY